MLSVLAGERHQAKPRFARNEPRQRVFSKASDGLQVGRVHASRKRLLEWHLTDDPLWASTQSAIRRTAEARGHVVRRVAAAGPTTDLAIRSDGVP